MDIQYKRYRYCVCFKYKQYRTVLVPNTFYIKQLLNLTAYESKDPKLLTRLHTDPNESGSDPDPRQCFGRDLVLRTDQDARK